MFDAREEAAKLMREDKPESLGEFMDAAKRRGFDENKESAMWKAHIKSLSDQEYRKKAGLPERF